jgi:hypothetical protein
MRFLLRLLFFVLPATASAAAPAPVSPSPSGFCDSAIYAAERTAGVPPRVLAAIAEVESGRPDAASGTVHPWPWTIDAEGRGQFFETKAQAVAAVRVLQTQGVRSIDVGCMQVNLMHHPNAFASLDQAFDPQANALYAARFLNSLYGESGSWLQAIAAYHSETPAIGAGYRQRVMARLQFPDARGLAGWNISRSAYRDFAPSSHVYGAFPATNNTYGVLAGSPSRLEQLARR